jgi:phage anti-repressor protein/DNA-directed RNA polymerase subunit H (RpoH/RPB5)
MDISFNIVGFIESNPVAKLSDTYNNKLLIKIKENFNETQQQLFISSFYCYLNYHPTNDFVIDLDDVWKWLGFSTKQKARMLLEKQFIVENDYKLLLNHNDRQNNDTRGGHNKQTIMLNLKTFKLYCIKADTKKANEIHEYFVKLEELLHETIHDECIELKQQLENQVLISHNQQDILRENTILKQFPANTLCVYYGKIDNKSDKGEDLIKFGYSNSLCDRVKTHKKTYENFFLIHAFKVDNAQQIENAIKFHPELSKLKRSLIINETRFTELMAYNTITFENLDGIIKDIIKKIEYSPENYTMLLLENERLLKKINTLTIENQNLHKIKYGDPTVHVDATFIPEIHEIPEIRTFKHVRKYNKAKDGKYHIFGVVYDKLIGTREEVWYGTAFRTPGELQKKDLMLSASAGNRGKIISKSKHHSENARETYRFCVPKKVVDTTNDPEV